MLHHLLENVRSQAPLVHCITNYVTVNDCANILLACGASPIMADDPEEAADITGGRGGIRRLFAAICAVFGNVRCF